MKPDSDDPEVESRSRLMAFQNTLRKHIITGVIILVPLVVTFLVLRLVFQWLDSLAQPLIKQVLGSEDDIPGLGIALTFVVVWLAGAVGGNVVGRRLIGHGDELLARIPVIGSIYGPVKQFIQNVTSAKPTTHFKRVVLAEYPSDDRWILGFATGEVSLPGQKVGRCVFVPTSPNPATGWMVIFPQNRVVETELSVEEAMRLIVSGGIVVPEKLGKACTVEPTNEVGFPTPPGAPPGDPPEATDSASASQSIPRSGHAG